VKGGFMIDIKQLKAEMLIKDIRVPGLAREIGIDKVTFYRKLSGKSEFTISEIYRIIEILKIPDEKVIAIFFKKKVS